MLFMVELHFKEEQRDAALKYFWDHGSSRYEGQVSVANLWVASQDHVAYALIEAHETEEVHKACVPLQTFGELTVRSVASADEL